MSVDGLSGLVNRVIAWADRLQREHGVLGFPYAVVKKYGDDEGGRQAALITYYGFLSLFPLLLLGVAVLSRVLADHPDLRRRLIAEIVPPALRPTIEHSLATMPTSTVPFAVGLIGLLLSGTGVVFSAYQTLNHVAAVRHRRRASFFSRYVRVFVVLAALMAGAVAVGALTVVATALPGQPGLQRAAAVLGSAVVVFAVLLLGAKVLLARPAPIRALWPGAIVGAAAVTVVLNVGTPLLAREQERIPAARVQFHLAGRGSPPEVLPYDAVMSESSPATFPITTALGLQGMIIERDLGLTFGLVVRSMGFAKSFGAGLTALRQGEVPQYTSLLEDSRRHAIDRLIDNARLLGANAVVAMRFDSSEISQQLTEIVAYGTAVVVRPAE